MYTTERLGTDAYGLVRAAELLNGGEIVAIPTETVYGLAALPKNAHKLNAVKGSAPDKPITCLADDALSVYYTVSVLAEPEIAVPMFAKDLLESGVTAIFDVDGLSRGYRIPQNWVAQELLEQTGIVLACTSANMSGGAPAVDADEVMRVFGGRIAAIVDGGRCEHGIASAVVDFTVDPPNLIRAGVGLEPGELERIYKLYANR
ncbi:MAG: L-threonylcarbamoyladenylate synthase [Oscillospiraceae bacterium]|jgi:L-threonylcarbamoyladenylate synthase|nr:L-threonylcarbamoyladenylate synthase [Oscillospiraceae bacterium]